MEICFVLLLLLFLLKMAWNIKLMQPHGLFITVWLVFIAGSILLLGNNYKFYYLGIAWMICAIIAFSCGFCVVKLKLRMRKSSVSRKAVPQIPWRLFLFFIFLAFLDVVMNAGNYGVGFSDLSSFQALQTASHNAAVQRYSNEGVSAGVLGQMLNVFLYILPVCAGYNLPYAKKKSEKILCAGSFVPTFLIMVITTAKLAVIAYVILFFAGFYTSYLYKKQEVMGLNFKRVMGYGFLGLILFAMFVFSFILRIGAGEENLLKVIINKLGIYAFGHVQGFAAWFEQMDYLNLDFGFGGYTFWAVSSRIGFTGDGNRIYQIVNDACTNVYTPFRDIIEDFGIFFSLLLLFFAGMITALFYMYVRYGSRKHVACQIGLVVSLFSMFYFIVSPWRYTTYLLAFFVFAVYISIAFQKGRNRKYIYEEKIKQTDQG